MKTKQVWQNTICPGFIDIRDDNKKVSCRIDTARRFVSLNISLSYLRSLKTIRN